jgi:hypothetical protein
MGRYINWADVTGRYRELGKEQGAEEVGDHYVAYAEAQLDGALGGVFATPFSSNNTTAKDLAIDLTYVRMSRRTKPKDAEAVFKATMDQIAALKSGTLAMVTNSGDLSFATGINGGLIDSTTKDYAPTFSMVEHEVMQVSSAQILDELDNY